MVKPRACHPSDLQCGADAVVSCWRLRFHRDLFQKYRKSRRVRTRTQCKSPKAQIQVSPLQKEFYFSKTQMNGDVRVSCVFRVISLPSPSLETLTIVWIWTICVCSSWLSRQLKLLFFLSLALFLLFVPSFCVIQINPRSVLVLRAVEVA